MRMKIYRRPSDGVAAGDAIPFFWDGEYHLFYLTSPAGTKKYPERVRTTWRHAVSKDLTTWTELPNALFPGEGSEPDANGVWTGSVIRAQDKFHIFYTGYRIESDFPQTICHAVSDDLIHWTKDESHNPLIVPDTSRYENIDWRDPYVLWNENEQCYWMLVAARKNSGPDGRRGCIALCTSTDLIHWEIQDSIYEPYLTNCPECPEMFQIGEQWYLAFSRFSESAQTIYRVSDNPRGPWRTPSIEGIDGRRFYAAKSLENDNKRRFYFGWVHDREGAVDDGEWEWGGDFTVPREVVHLANNELGIKCPKEILECYPVCNQVSFKGIVGMGSQPDTNTVHLKGTSTLAYGFLDVSTSEFLFECKLTPIDVRDSFGILLKTDSDIERGYMVNFDPRAQRVRLLKLPQPVDPFWQTLSGKSVPAPEVDGPAVVERPLSIENEKTVDCKVIITDSIIEIFVDNKVALTYRAYESGQYQLGLLVQDGTLYCNDISIKSR
jgi:beta-fructofuranosidase